MKTLFVALAALLFAFFLGCQSSITDPEISSHTKYLGSAGENTHTYKDAFSFKYPNQIKLEGTLLDPSHRPNGYAEISGVVRFGIREVKGESVAINSTEFYKTAPSGTPDKKFKVDLYIDAELKGGHYRPHRPWTVKKAADQIVDLNSANQSTTYIQQSFRVKNTCCAPLDLIVKFKVNEKELKLVSMELKLVTYVKPIPVEE
jgi:hypothetical protein